jgi:hypothetical protein
MCVPLRNGLPSTPLYNGAFGPMLSGMHDLEVFYGELTPIRAVVYARLPRPSGESNLTLTGTIRGPRCLHAQTLPATWQLADLGPGPTLLARALVTEPCFWSPDLPAVYDVTVRVQRGEETVATERREIGFKPLGIRGPQFIMAGKNWVLLGIARCIIDFHNSTVAAPLARRLRRLRHRPAKRRATERS